MPAKDLKRGMDAKGAAEKLLAEASFEEALAKAKDAVEFLEDAGEEEAAALSLLSTAFLATGNPKLAMEKAKAALALAESIGQGPKAAAMLTVVKTCMGYKVVPASILSSEAAVFGLKAQAGSAAGTVGTVMKAIPAIDYMCPTIDLSVLADKLDEAGKVADDALAFFKECGDKKGEGMALYLATYVKSERRSLRDVLPALEEVQKLYKDAGATKEEELVLKDILGHHLANADTEAASKLKGAVLEGDKKEGAAALIRVIADAYFTMKDSEEAQKLVMEALNTFRGLGDKAGEVSALRATINLHLAKGEIDDAIQVADQIVGKLDNKTQKGASMYLMAGLQLSKDGAVPSEILGRAKTSFKEAGDSQLEAEALMVIAEMQAAGGDGAAALSAAQDALSVCKAGGMKELEVAALRTVVAASMAQEDENGAMKAATEALNKSKELGSKPSEIASLKSVAEIHLAKGNPSSAIETATEMLSLSVDVGDVGGQASAKLVLANAILSADGGSAEGIQYGREALAQFEAGGDTFGTASTLYMLANACFARADLEEGLKYAREALAIFRSTGDAMNEEILKQIIEEARTMTAEYRKQTPKRPMAMPAGGGPPPSTGPETSPITDSKVPKELLEPAVASRKYWGIPKMVQQDPTVDAIERAPSHSIIFGQNLSDNVPTQVCVEFGDLVATMAKGDVAKIPIVVTTCGVNGRMTGEHVPTHMTGVSAVTVWGMVRTVKQEIPQVQCVLLDFSAAQTMAQIPRNLRMPPMVAESAYYHGARWEPQLAQVPSLFRRELKRDNLTGGGGGSNMGDPKKAAKFMRRSFNWTGPSHKLDFAWYRQEWRAVGAAMGDIGPMPPQQPCKAIRSV